MLIEVENFLPIDILNSLVDFSKRTDIPWQVQELQENLPRKKISWLPDSPIETVHNYFQSLPLFSHLNFMGVTLWSDGPNFFMEEHVDNNRVKIAIQIYLDDRNSPGTQFEDRLIRYGRNRGYILYNNPKIPHCVPKQSPHEGRLSIYALYQ